MSFKATRNSDDNSYWLYYSTNVRILSAREIYYKKGKTATQAAKKICDVYGHDVVSVRVVQSWFKYFQSGNFDVKDALRSGQSITGKVDEIMEKVE